MLDKAKKEVLEQIVSLLKENDLSVKDLQNYMSLQEKITEQMAMPDPPQVFYKNKKACGIVIGDILLWGKNVEGKLSYSEARMCGWLIKENKHCLVLPVVWRTIQRRLEAVNFLLEENGMEPLTDEYLWTCAEVEKRVYLYNPVTDTEVKVTKDSKAACRPVFVRK